jgi:hypothetical protein
MATLYILDRLVPKHISLQGVDDSIRVPVWEKVIYTIPWDAKEYIWFNVWYPVDTDKKWSFAGLLKWSIKEKFERYQEKSKKYYEIFKKEFPVVCPWAIPITVRSDLQWQQIYFYFYSEERYNFADFVRSFRAVVPVQFFIYQLGARDMMRYTPNAKEYLTACWCGDSQWCCSLGKLPNVELDNIALQSLEWRDIEKLKWRCWKLKCSMVYERELYLAETASFPKKWESGTMNWQACVCIWYNIMTGDIVAKTSEWEIVRGAKQTFLHTLQDAHV